MFSINKDNFLKALARARLTDIELSDKSGVSRTVISTIKSGKREKVRPCTIGKLAEAMGVTIESLA